MANWHSFIPAGILAGGCVLLFGVHRQSEMPLRSPLVELPATYQDYKSADRVVSDEEQRIAGMDSYLMRVFSRDSLDQFSVYVGYYKLQYQGHSAHSPKNCLPGSGWEPLNQRTETITTADGGKHLVNRYLLMKENHVALVYYWYQGRGRVAWDEYQVKWDLLRDAAIYGRTEEALVRIVVPVVLKATAKGAALDEQAAPADSLATKIAQEWIPKVNKALPAPMT